MPDAGIETMLHAACVKAGAASALQVALDRLPMLKPFLPRAHAPERIQRLLIKEIYARYQIRPAGWELEGILVVAQTQSVLTPLASQAGLRAVLQAWVPDRLSTPLIRFTPLEPLVAPRRSRSPCRRCDWQRHGDYAQQNWPFPPQPRNRADALRGRAQPGK